MFYMVIADGEIWEDSNGDTEWPYSEAAAIADSLEYIGYITDIIG